MTGGSTIQLYVLYGSVACVTELTRTRRIVYKPALEPTVHRPARSPTSPLDDATADASAVVRRESERTGEGPDARPSDPRGRFRAGLSIKELELGVAHPLNALFSVTRINSFDASTRELYRTGPRDSPRIPGNGQPNANGCIPIPPPLSLRPPHTHRCHIARLVVHGRGCGLV